jgi:hypothetical protein
MAQHQAAALHEIEVLKRRRMICGRQSCVRPLNG